MKSPIVVTRQGGKGNVVMISEAEFAGWQDTVHLLSSPKNAERLLRGVRQVHFSDDGWDDYLHWAIADAELHKRLNKLIENLRRTLFIGLGKPEALKGDLSGWWSRRITGGHRLVYRVQGWKGEDQRVEIIQCCYHY